MKPNNIDIMIDTLRNFELNAALLYETFSRVFPQEKEKWQEFADEERIHAQWLAELKLPDEDDQLSFNETRFTIQSINESIEFVQLHIDRAKNNETTLKEAVQVALRIENSIIENSILSIFNFSTVNARFVRLKLFRETRAHRDRFSRWLEEIEA